MADYVDKEIIDFNILIKHLNWRKTLYADHKKEPFSIHVSYTQT